MQPAPVAPIFEAVIVPHRSLSRRGRLVLSGAMAGAIGAAGLVFLLLGAWPVVGFSGAEIGLAIFLLHVNARQARGSEVVVLHDGTARITRTDPRGRRTETVLPLGWLRMELQERPGRVPGLLLCHRHEEVEIGTALGEDDKRSLAAALSAALERVRNPRFDNPQLR